MYLFSFEIILNNKLNVEEQNCHSHSYTLTVFKNLSQECVNST